MFIQKRRMVSPHEKELSRILPNLSTACNNLHLKKKKIFSFLRIVMVSKFGFVDKMLITIDIYQYNYEDNLGIT